MAGFDLVGDFPLPHLVWFRKWGQWSIHFNSVTSHMKTLFEKCEITGGWTSFFFRTLNAGVCGK